MQLNLGDIIIDICDGEVVEEHVTISRPHHLVMFIARGPIY